MTLHKDLTDPELHETKGASTAAAGAVLTADGLGAATFSALPSSNVFGEDFDSAETLFFQSSTTANTFQQALRLTLSVTNGGTFLIAWHYVWSYDDANSDFRGRVQLNDSTDLMVPEHRQEPNDVAGAGAGGTDQRHVVTGFAAAVLGAGSHTIDIDYTPSSSSEAGVHSARIVAFRVI